MYSISRARDHTHIQHTLKSISFCEAIAKLIASIKFYALAYHITGPTTKIPLLLTIFIFFFIFLFVSPVWGLHQDPHLPALIYPTHYHLHISFPSPIYHFHPPFPRLSSSLSKRCFFFMLATAPMQGPHRRHSKPLAVPASPLHPSTFSHHPPQISISLPFFPCHLQMLTSIM